MKSILKRVSSLVMAGAMVLSLATVAPVDAQAATKLAITKKSAITAGKTYTYNVKGVTKAQYIKVKMSSGVTVKCNSKTVKKNVTKIKGGNTIALKVKAADKVANYKATVKAVVYDKKTNKKVKTLTTQSKVNVTTLKVTNVTVASTSGKYLVATFNKALSNLSVADIEIIKLNTGELKGVEKVDLASDGKSATITLVGSEDASKGIANSFVEANVDYSFKVSQSGVSASTNFTVDAVKAFVTVTSVNPALREIGYSKPIAKNTNTDANAGTVKLPETVNNDDFQELLGTTINVWYNKNNVATKMTRVDEQIVYGSFKYINKNTSTPYFQNKATDEKYYVSQNIGVDSDIHTSYEIATKIGGGYTFSTAYTPAGNEDSYDYMKLVLYSNGTIRTMLDNRNFNEKLLVTKVDGKFVYSGDKYSVNFEGFTILKDGKTASLADIQAGDVVFASTANKFAEIYTTTKEGKVEAAYDNEFKFDGTNYLNANVKTIKDNASTNVNYTIMSAFITAGGAAKVYLDRAGQVIFITGDTKYAADGSEVTIMMTNFGPKSYTDKGVDYIQIEGFDGTKKSKYGIAADNLQWAYFTDKAGGGEAKYVVDSKQSAGSDSPKDAKTKEIKTKNFKFADNKIDILTEAGTSIWKVSASDAKYTVVTMKKDNDGNIIGLTFKKAMTPDADFVGAKTAVTCGGQSYQITKGTAVWAYDKDPATKYNKVTYGDYSATTVSGKTKVYTGSTGSPYDVAFVVVENANVTAPTTFVDGIVGTILSKDGKVAEVKVFAAGAEAITYDTFLDDTVKTSIASNVKAGDYVRVGVAKDSKTVVTMDTAFAKAGMTVTAMSVSSDNVKPADNKFVLSDGTEVKLANKYTIVKRVKNLQDTVRYEKAELAELGGLSKTDKISIHYAEQTANPNKGTGYVDVVIIDYNYAD